MCDADDVSWVRPVYTAMLFSIVSHLGVSGWFFIAWRAKFPLSGRKIWIVIATAVALVLWVSVDHIIQLACGIPCTLDLFLLYFMIIWMQNAYLARAWNLWFLYFKAEEHIAYKRRRDNSFFGFAAARSSSDLEARENSVDVRYEASVTDTESNGSSCSGSGKDSSMSNRRGSKTAGVPKGLISGERGSKEKVTSDQKQTVVDEGNVKALVNKGDAKASVGEDSANILVDKGAAEASNDKNSAKILAEEGGAEASTDEESSHSAALSELGSWFADRRHWVDEAFIAKWVTALSFVEWIPIVAVRLSEHDIAQISTTCDSVFPIFYVSGVTGLTVLFAIYTTWRLRKVQENFHIKHELLEAAVFAALTLVVSNSLPGEYFRIEHGVYLAGCHMLLFSMLTEPVIRAHVAEKRRLASKRPSAEIMEAELNANQVKPSPGHVSEDLSGVMSDPRELQAFTEFLKREFCVENLLFYRDCRKFSTAACAASGGPNEQPTLPVEKRNFRAMEIFDEYLTPRSVMEVNVPGRLIEPIRDALRECIKDFDPNASATRRSSSRFPTLGRSAAGQSGNRSLRHNPFSGLAAPPVDEAAEEGGEVAAAGQEKQTELERERCLAPVPHDVFAAAASSVYKLMASDSFPRFRKERIRALGEAAGSSGAPAIELRSV